MLGHNGRSDQQISRSGAAKFKNKLHEAAKMLIRESRNDPKDSLVPGRTILLDTAKQRSAIGENN